MSNSESRRTKRHPIDDIKKMWDKATPNQRKYATIGVLALAAVVLLTLSSGDGRSKSSSVLADLGKDVNKAASLHGDSNALEKSVYNEVMGEIDRIKASQARDQREQERAEEEAAKRKAKEGKNFKSTPVVTQLPSLPDQIKAETESIKGMPVLPPPPPSYSRGSAVLEEEEASDVGTVLVGGIAHYRIDPPTAAPASEPQKKNSVRLPPSFMAATMLVGVDAPSVQDGKDKPKPLVMRVDAPAVLPNRVKANLSGCFIQATGIGALAEERIDARLTRLTCLADGGKAMIDTKIEGYIIDADGKVGLSAHVYSKMGATMARQALSGVFSGIGQSINLSASNTSTSALGTVETIDSDQVFKSGIGGGIQRSSQAASDFYLDLAKQTVPVLESLPDRVVTIFVSETAELEILLEEEAG